MAGRSASSDAERHKLHSHAEHGNDTTILKPFCNDMNGDMSMKNQTNKNEHETIAALLPWLVNGTLSAKESKRVEAHLLLCDQCRNQVSQLQTVNKQVAEEKSEWEPSSAHFSSILSEVERSEPVTPKQKKTKHKSRFGFFENLLQTPNPVRWTLAIESVAIVALLTVWNISPQMGLPSNVELYQTLSDNPQEKPTQDTGRIRLLLDDAMTTADLTQLLQQTDAQIRQGPSALGLFVVEVPLQGIEKTLEIFLSHQHIRLAEKLEVTP